MRMTIRPAADTARRTPRQNTADRGRAVRWRGYGMVLAALLALALPALSATTAGAATRPSRSGVRAGLTLVPVNPAAAAVGPYELVNLARDLCLDAVASGDGRNGDNVQLWTCNGTNNQYWYLPTSVAGEITLGGEITNAAHGLCLDAVASGDGRNGDNVQLWTCNNTSNQVWSGGPYAGEITNDAHVLCLDAVASGDGRNGDNVQLWTCNGTSNQGWDEF